MNSPEVMPFPVPLANPAMSLNYYQTQAYSLAKYPQTYAIVYPALGLAGEAGEVAEKVKKFLRDDTWDEDAVIKELGDVLWYIAALASDLGVSLEHVAQTNLDKLFSRKERNVLSGSGDNR